MFVWGRGLDSLEEKSAAIRSALALRRGEQTQSLQLSLPVELLIDSDHCSEVSAALKAIASAWETAPALPGLGETLPESPGLYMFVWEPEFSLFMASDEKSHKFRHILYVGKTGGTGSQNTLKNRYNSEYAKYVGGDPKILWEPLDVRTREDMLKRYLTLHPLEFWYVEFPETSKDHIDSYEEYLRKLLCPPCNIQQPKTRVRRGPACPAF